MAATVGASLAYRETGPPSRRGSSSEPSFGFALGLWREYIGPTDLGNKSITEKSRAIPTQGGSAMPNWLIPLLKGGGLALAVVFAIAVILIRILLVTRRVPPGHA